MRWKKLKIMLAALLALLLLLAATPGSRNDPLVTAEWVEQYVDEQAAALEKRLDALEEELHSFQVVRLWLGKSYFEQNGENKLLDAAPYASTAGRTYLPLRALGEIVGAEFKWDAATKKVTCLKGDATIILFVGSSSITVNGRQETIDAPPEIVNGRTFVPVRVIGEKLGFEVSWEPAEKMVTLTY